MGFVQENDSGPDLHHEYVRPTTCKAELLENLLQQLLKRHLAIALEGM
jgi:hypothetical protein